MMRFDIWRWLILALLVGCSHTEKRPTIASGPVSIDKLNLLAAPIAMNLDGRPGADAVAVKVYAGNTRQPRPVAITAGTLELLAFEGLLGKTTNVPTPFKTWTFTASELRRMQFQASIGVGYEITASFIGQKPNSDKLTVLARYRPDATHEIYSSN
jgi:hypothetical protein